MEKYQSRYPVDLHSHSTRSDGADTPQELIDHAASAGVKVLAITDHDIRPPERITLSSGENADVAEYAARKGISLLRGIEISCETTVEDCHIVCLGCNWGDPFFDRLESSVRESKIAGYQELISRLSKDGIDITWDEVLENGGNPVTEDHVQKKMIFELIARRGFTKDWAQAKLMVRNTPRYEIQRKKPDPAEVIGEVHRIGGIAILAHPYLINEPVCVSSETMSRADYIERLLEAGLDGIEASYPYDKTSYGGNMTPDEIEAKVRERYAGRVRILSGGSDYHNDAKKGVRNPRELGERGITLEYYALNQALQALAAGRSEEVWRS